MTSQTRKMDVVCPCFW